MYFLRKVCCVCLSVSKKLKTINDTDRDNIKIEQKLIYCTTKYRNIRPPTPLFICSRCRRNLSIAYEFKKSYYKSCRILKGYVSQLRNGTSRAKYKRNDLQVKVMNLGECMIDGEFPRDLIKIENVETQIVNSVVQDSSTKSVDNIQNSNITNKFVVLNMEENNLRNSNNNNITEYSVNTEYIEDNSDNFLSDDIETYEEFKSYCDNSCGLEIDHGNIEVYTEENPNDCMSHDIKTYEEYNTFYDNTCEFGNDPENTIDLNNANLSVQTVNDIIEPANVVPKTEIDMDISEDIKDICHIWFTNAVENTNEPIIEINSIDMNRNEVEASVQMEVEITVKKEVIEDTNFEDVALELIDEEKSENSTKDGDTETDESEISESFGIQSVNYNIINTNRQCDESQLKWRHLMRSGKHLKCSVCKKKFKHQYDLTRHSCNDGHYICDVRAKLNSGDLFRCCVCNKLFAHKHNTLNFLIIRSGKRPFCSTVCEKHYDEKYALKIANQSNQKGVLMEQ